MQRLLWRSTPNNIETEKLDDILTEACEAGENACRRRQKYHWSVDLHNIKRQLSIWRIFQSFWRRKLSTISIITQANEIGVTIADTIDHSIVTNTIADLWKQLEDIHAEAASKREEMLTNLANFAADINDKQKAKVLRQMKRSERKARVYSLLKYEKKKQKFRRHWSSRGSVLMANNGNIQRHDWLWTRGSEIVEL